MFDSARQKIDRAEHHLRDLHDRFVVFSDAKPYSIRHEFNLETGTNALVYRPTRPLDPEWSVIIGELLYDLRSALDHVMFELGPMPRSEFPIFADKDLFFETERNGKPTRRSGLYKMRGASSLAKEAITNVQPFNTRQAGQESVLFILGEMCNIDKHRTLHLCCYLPESIRVELMREITLEWFQFSMPGILRDGTVLFERRLPGGVEGSEMDMNCDLTIDIAFDDGRYPAIHGAPVEHICKTLIGGARSVIDYIERVII